MNAKPSIPAEPNLLADLVREADRCVMCGLCLPHCPTYKLLRDEGDSPRGRISLIRGMASGRLELTDHLQGHLDRCLTCRACEVVCPADVHYGKLIDGARQAIATQRPKPLLSLLLRHVIAKPRALRTLAWLGYGSSKLGLDQLLSKLELRGAPTLKQLLKLAPAIKRPQKPKAHYSAHGQRQGHVALFTGCAASILDQSTISDAIKVLTALGFDVDVPSQQNCCGALPLHIGDKTLADTLSGQNNQAFADSRYQAVIWLASGCGAHLQENARTTNSCVPWREICDFVATVNWPQDCKPAPDLRIAVHEPCTHRNIVKNTKALYDLLARVPNAHIQALASNSECCGAAGSYFLTQPAMAQQLRERKLSDIQSMQPNVVVSSNIGCALHIGIGLRKNGQDVPVVHPISIIARQLGPVNSKETP